MQTIPNQEYDIDSTKGDLHESIRRLDPYIPYDLMRFRLTYDGPLVTGNSRAQSKAKWGIREHLRPQLEQLWETHPALTGVWLSARVGGNVKIAHHKEVRQALKQPIVVEEKQFIPLVRKSLELACELEILFLRQEEPGSLIFQGGDIDNRIKTLFDALKVPGPEDVKGREEVDAAQPFCCLLEQDALITSFSVTTDRLLAKPNMPVSQVYLVIEVNVRVMKLTETNIGFLGE